MILFDEMDDGFFGNVVDGERGIAALGGAGDAARVPGPEMGPDLIADVCRQCNHGFCCVSLILGSRHGLGNSCTVSTKAGLPASQGIMVCSAGRDARAV